MKVARAFFLLLALALTFRATVHAQAQAGPKADPAWGTLTQIVNHDYLNHRNDEITVRWEEYNERMVITNWRLFGRITWRFILNRQAGKVEIESKTFVSGDTDQLTVEGDDSLIVLGKHGATHPGVDRDADGRFTIAAYISHLMETYRPIPPGHPAAEKIARLVQRGKVTPAAPVIPILIANHGQTGPPDTATPRPAVPTPSRPPEVAIRPKAPTTSPTASPTPTTPQEPRIALVIGNANYGVEIGRLANPGNDARLITAGLEAAGFQVELVLDADQQNMKQAILRLGARLTAAGKGATGLFYYAGHGMQTGDINYLIPVGAVITREEDVDKETVAADVVLNQMVGAGTSTSIIILDACRNTPVIRTLRDGTFGLARMVTLNGSFFSYSTAPGAVARDGAGNASPFALALNEEMQSQGQPVEIAFRNVRRNVLLATKGRQTPWDSSSLIDAFMFKP